MAEYSEQENPICKKNSVEMIPPVSPSSGDPKKVIDPVSTNKTPILPAVEGIPEPNLEVNADSEAPTEGFIPDLVNAILKNTTRSDKACSPTLDREKILEIATHITENILKYSSADFSRSNMGKSASVENVASGVPISGIGGPNMSPADPVGSASGGPGVFSSNPVLEEREIDGAEGGALPVPLAAGSAEKSAVSGSDGSNPVVTPPVEEPVVAGGIKDSSGGGDPSSEPGSAKSFLDVTTASPEAGYLGSVDFSAAIPNFH
ncbi:hypothetical protein OROMI_031422 [Orobanche minor]